MAKAELYQGARQCAICGEELTGGYFWKMPERLGARNVPFCQHCMDRIYRNMAATVGYKLAFFMACAFFNVPYKPEMLNLTDGQMDGRARFETYLNAIKAKAKANVTAGRPSFCDGLTDITQAFGGEFATLEVDDEMLNDAEYKDGHLNQVKDWGAGPEKRPYTQQDYDQLDKFWEAMTSERVNVSKQAEIAIRNICVMRLEQQYAIYNGEYAEAKRLEDIIKAEMEGEQLRKKDELPQDRVRLDDIVIACERAGLLGLSYDELLEKLAKHVFHTKYGYTRDAADQMLLYIVNATRTNEGYAELDRLPDDFAIQDNLGEFAEEPDDVEKQIYKDLHIAPLNMKAKGGDLKNAENT